MWPYFGLALTVYSIIATFDAFEISCIWKYYGKWFGANAPFSIIFSKVFKTLLILFYFFQYCLSWSKNSLWSKGLKNNCPESAIYIAQKSSLICLFCCITSQVNSYGHGGTVSSYNHFFLGKLEQAINQYFVHILSLVTDNNPSWMIQRKGGEWP